MVKFITPKTKKLESLIRKNDPIYTEIKSVESLYAFLNLRIDSQITKHKLPQTSSNISIV